jgi:hypothetical protein
VLGNGSNGGDEDVSGFQVAMDDEVRSAWVVGLCLGEVAVDALAIEEGENLPFLDETAEDGIVGDTALDYLDGDQLREGVGGADRFLDDSHTP